MSLRPRHIHVTVSGGSLSTMIYGLHNKESQYTLMHFQVSDILTQFFPFLFFFILLLPQTEKDWFSSLSTGG